jgi:signal transduction histidine kinase
MPNASSPPPHTTPGIASELRSAILTLVAAVLVVTLGAMLFLAGTGLLSGSALSAGVAVVTILVGLGAGTHFLIRRVVERPLRALSEIARVAASGDTARVEELAKRAGHAAAEHREIAQALARISRQLHAERAQRQQLDKLATVGRAAAGIAHEIGNPLGALSNSVEVLRIRTRGAGVDEVLDLMDREVRRADRISRGLIDLARPRTPTPFRTDVNECVRSAVRLLDDQGVMRRHKVVLQLDPTEPAVFGSREDLQQVVLNLLLNAVDATPPDGRIAVATNRLTRMGLEEGLVRRTGDPPLTIRPRPESPRIKEWLARVRPPAEVVSLVVADSGVGVQPEDAERIFEPFYTTKGTAQGTGLGLAVVSNLVDSLRGTIWVCKAREGGAAFHMLYPVAVGSGMAAISETEPSEAQAG